MTGIIPFDRSKRLNSANTQAEFYRRCREENVECILEYRHEKCRFDAVIIFCEAVVFIVEIKNYKRKTIRKISKQLSRYGAFGVPFIVIKCPEEIEPAIKEIKCHLERLQE